MRNVKGGLTVPAPGGLARQYDGASANDPKITDFQRYQCDPKHCPHRLSAQQWSPSLAPGNGVKGEAP